MKLVPLLLATAIAIDALFLAPSIQGAETSIEERRGRGGSRGGSRGSSGSRGSGSRGSSSRVKSYSSGSSSKSFAKKAVIAYASSKLIKKV